MEVLYKIFDYEIKAVDEEELAVQHFISTEKKDRRGDIMHADGMVVDGIPVVLLEHGKGFMGTEPIAKPLWIRPGTWKRNKGIEANTKFFPDETGVRLWKKTKEKFMPNWSVGYGIIKGTAFKNGGIDIVKWKLYEYSLVGVSMNPHANTKDNDMPNMMVKYLPFGMINRIHADDGIIKTCSMYEDRVYTEDLASTTKELNYLLKDLDEQKKTFGMYDSKKTPPKDNESFEKTQSSGKSADTTEDGGQGGEETEVTKDGDSPVSQGAKNSDLSNNIIEKIDHIEKKMHEFIGAVDDKFKEYSETIKKIQEEKREKRIIFKHQKEPKKEEIKIPKKCIDAIVDWVKEEYIKEFRKVIGKVD